MSQDQLTCPFTSTGTTKWCIWQVLKDHPTGLPLGALVELVVKQREITFKNPTGAISGELSRDKEHFCKAGSGRWALSLFGPFDGGGGTGPASGRTAAATNAADTSPERDAGHGAEAGHTGIITAPGETTGSDDDDLPIGAAAAAAAAATGSGNAPHTATALARSARTKRRSAAIALSAKHAPSDSQGSDDDVPITVLSTKPAADTAALPPPSKRQRTTVVEMIVAEPPVPAVDVQNATATGAGGDAEDQEGADAAGAAPQQGPVTGGTRGRGR
ncbi:hypothetical protein Vretifemale_9728, partial [Volvox reticuliferus]